MAETLNALFTPTLAQTPEGRRYTSWQTPWGVAFEDHGMSPIYFYRYDADIGHLRAEREGRGALSDVDINKVVKKLSVNPQYLRRKPESVAYLERVTGESAHRKRNAFGKWALVRTGMFSMFNNPFGLSLGYTRGPNEYEIWFFEKEQEPRENQSVMEITDALQMFGYA